MELISSILTIGSNLAGGAISGALNKGAEKQARLVASTERDMGITANLANFINSLFDTTDPRTSSLISAAKADLSITDPNDKNRGDRIYSIKQNAVNVLASQIKEGRVSYLPSGYEIPYAGGKEDSKSLADEISSDIVWEALVKIAKEKTGKDRNTIFKEATGRDYVSPQKQPENRAIGIEAFKKVIGFQNKSAVESLINQATQTFTPLSQVNPTPSIQTQEDQKEISGPMNNNIILIGVAVLVGVYALTKGKVKK